MTIKDGDFIKNTYQVRVRLSDEVIAHLVFHLKLEIISFESLYRVFKKIDSGLIERYIHTVSTGQYARRMDFLCGWLTVDTDRIIRSIIDNQGKRSNKLINEYLMLTDDELWVEVVERLGEFN